MRFAADENFNGRILSALLERLPDLDIVRIQDTVMSGANDPELLAWLADEERILLTHDAQTIPGFAYDRVKASQRMPGVIIVRETISIGQTVDELEIMIVASDVADFENTVRYIPL